MLISPAVAAPGTGAPNDETGATDGGGSDGNDDDDDPPIEYRRLRSYTFEKVAMGEVRDGMAGQDLGDAALF